MQATSDEDAVKVVTSALEHVTYGKYPKQYAGIAVAALRRAGWRHVVGNKELDEAARRADGSAIDNLRRERDAARSLLDKLVEALKQIAEHGDGADYGVYHVARSALAAVAEVRKEQGR